MSKGDWIAAGALAVTGLAAALGVYRELGEHGVRIERFEGDVQEVKADVKELVNESREWRKLRGN